MDKISEVSFPSDLVLWIVWYEDRFGIGSDRDPASIVGLFKDEAAAEHYINTHEGPIDIQSGKFDGLFLEKFKATELIRLAIASTDDILRLLKMDPPAQLLNHWEKGWI